MEAQTPHLRAVVNKKAHQRIVWAGEQGLPIAEDCFGVTFGQAFEDVEGFSVDLLAQLVSSTTDHPLSLVMWRSGPRAPGTKRDILKAILTNPPPNLTDETERHLTKVEGLMQKKLDEHPGVTGRLYLGSNQVCRTSARCLQTLLAC